MTKLIQFIGVVACIAGCSNSPSGTDVGSDAAGDFGALEDASGGSDAGAGDTGEQPDLSGDAMSVDLGADAAPDATSDGGKTEDVGTDASDAGGDPFEGRPLGQCTDDADCPVGPTGQMCSRALPGGACLGCGDDTHCPGTTTCSNFGACVTECVDDADCPPGTECGGTGRCGAIDCVNDVCPVELFGCNDRGRCERVDCSDDPGACPAATSCIDGRCIENRAVN